MLRSLSPTQSPSPSGSPVLKAPVMSVSYIFSLRYLMCICVDGCISMCISRVVLTNGRILYISSFLLLFPFFLKILVYSLAVLGLSGGTQYL